jgi:KipI family sensor histidine kinase inhibitor
VTQLGSPVPFGDSAVLVELGSVAAAHQLVAALEVERAETGAPIGFEESVVGFGNVVVHLDAGVGSVEEVGAWVARVAQRLPDPDTAAAGTAASRGARRVEIPVAFDGPDLVEVATDLGTTAEALAEGLCRADLEVAFLGFSPGFPYLVGLPPALASVSRRSTPRPSVPAGSVAVAGGFAAVYPTATPGGWRLLGRTSLPLFDPNRPPFARLRPGDTVRFVPGPADRPRVEPPARAPSARASAPADVAVVEPGLLTLIEDRGRRTSAGLGVPRAGAADPEAMRLANRLVGNGDGDAAVEMTAAGPTLRIAVATHLAVVGAGGDPDAVDLRVDGRPVGSGAVVPIGPGQTVAVGRVRIGLRAYLAFSGGVDVPGQLGSRSSDVLCGLGPPPLGIGDRLGLGTPSRPHGLLLHPVRSDRAGRHHRVRVLAGPHPLDPERHRHLLAARWVVGQASNRIGIRLLPEEPGPTAGPPAPAPSDAIPSTGMVTGAVQIPPDGRPIILMPDHATVGGYPVACCVISADLPVLGQLAPGDTLSLTLVDAAAARTARRQQERTLDQRVSGWFPTAAAT